METGDNEDATTPSRAVTGWTVGLICVAIVAAGVMVGGLLHKPEPELTTKPVTPTTTSEPSEPPEYSYVTPPVAFPVEIPGCDVVEPPQEAQFFSFVTADEPGYDNPWYPWFSGPKAVAMTQALRGALPEGVEVAFASDEESLLFQPILGDPEESEKLGWTRAHATLLRGERTGGLSVNVQQSTAPIPPCVAGDLDERRHLADGTIVDTHDTWSETNGVRTLSRSASAYLPDGSVVHASADDVAADGAGHTRAIPLDIDDLVALVTAPGLRVSAPVPPGTPNPPESCGNRWERSADIDQATARRLDAVLAGIPLEGLTLDVPLGALRPASMGGVCQAVRVTTPGLQSQLSIFITTGQALPAESDTSSVVDGEQVTSRRLPDGSVVENREWHTLLVDETASQTTRSVTVTHRSGTRVKVDSAAAGPTVSFAVLEAIALAPGLEVL